MYLSRVNVLAEQPDKLIAALQADHYQLHQLLWQLFPDRSKETPRDFLFRRDDNKGFPVFYLLSHTEPSPLAGVLAVESKPFNPQLQVGDQLAFSLRANPVKKAKCCDESAKYARHDVVMHLKKNLTETEREQYSQAELEQQAGECWLNQQAKGKGFKVLSVIAEGYQQHQFKKRGIKISTLDFQGILEVTDPTLFFTEVFYGKVKKDDEQPKIRGLGSGKAFGCGLMLIKRA